MNATNLIFSLQKACVMMWVYGLNKVNNNFRYNVLLAEVLSQHAVNGCRHADKLQAIVVILEKLFQEKHAWLRVPPKRQQIN